MVHRPGKAHASDVQYLRRAWKCYYLAQRKMSTLSEKKRGFDEDDDCCERDIIKLSGRNNDYMIRQDPCSKGLIMVLTQITAAMIT